MTVSQQAEFRLCGLEQEDGENSQNLQDESVPGKVLLWWGRREMNWEWCSDFFLALCYY